MIVDFVARAGAGIGITSRDHASVSPVAPAAANDHVAVPDRENPALWIAAGGLLPRVTAVHAFATDRLAVR